MTKKTSRLWLVSTGTLAVLVGLAMVPLSHGQQTADQNSQNGQAQTITATGCLQQAPNGSGYQLTDQSTNQTYALTASNGSIDFSSHVGHTVTVTGTPSSSSSSQSSSSAASNPSGSTGNPPESSSNAAGTSSTPQQLTVTHLKSVSGNCQM